MQEVNIIIKTIYIVKKEHRVLGFHCIADAVYETVKTKRTKQENCPNPWEAPHLFVSISVLESSSEIIVIRKAKGLLLLFFCVSSAALQPEVSLYSTCY